jgi:hypothetical protein
VLITSVEWDVAAALVHMSALRVRHAAELLLYSYLWQDKHSRSSSSQDIPGYFSYEIHQYQRFSVEAGY